MFNHIHVTYEATDCPIHARNFLGKLSKEPVVGCDFEVAVRYSSEELAHYQHILDTSTDKFARVDAQSRLNATALDHPSHCQLTHFTIAASEDTGYCIIMSNPEVTQLVLDYLTTTKQTQVWHNASYDFRHIYYHTNKFPLIYEDTQILAKTLLNHVNTWKANVRLKHLAGDWYGDWGISADNFTIEQMYEPHVLKYATTDACATYKLWYFMQDQCNNIDQLIKEEYNDTTNGLP